MMRRFIALCGLLAVLAAPATAERPGLWQLVPKDSMGLLVLPDVAASRAALRQTPLHKLYTETGLKPMVGDLLKPFEGQLKELGDKFAEAVGVRPRKLLAALKGELGVALISVGEGVPELLISVEYKDQEATAKIVLERFLKSVSRDASKRETTTVRGVDVITVPGRREGRPGASFAMVDGRLLLAPTRAVVVAALDRRDGTVKGDSLADDAGFQACRKAASGTEDGVTHLGLFVNLRAIWTRHGEDLPAELRNAMTAAGLMDLHAIGYVLRQVGGELSEAMHLHAPGERRGLIKLMAATPLADASALARVPAGAMGYSIGRLDLAGLWREAWAVVKAADAETHRKASEAVAKWEAKHQVELAGWLASFGTQVVAHTTLPDAGLLPQGITQIELADPKAFLAGLQQLGKAVGMELVTMAHGESTVYHLRPTLGELGRNPLKRLDRDPMAMVPLILSMLPTHVVIDGNWAVCAAAHQHLLDHLEDRAEAKPLTPATLSPGTTTLGVSRNARVWGGLYNTTLPLLVGFENWIRMFGVNFDARRLPRAEVLMKYLAGPSVVQMRTDAAGVTIRATGGASFGPAMLGGAMAGLSLGFMGMRSEPGAPRRMPPPPKPLTPRGGDGEPGGHKATGGRKMAADFKLPTPDGKMVALSDLRGQVVVIDFWATWCGPCRRMMPGLQRVHDAYKGRAVRVLGINVWDDKGKAIQFMKDSKYGYGLLLEGDAVAKAYGVHGIPTLVVIGADGRVIERHVGYSADAEKRLRASIDRALAAMGGK